MLAMDIRLSRTLPPTVDCIEQKVLLRTDSHFYLLCNLEPSQVSLIFPGPQSIVHRTPGPIKKEVSLCPKLKRMSIRSG